MRRHHILLLIILDEIGIIRIISYVRFFGRIHDPWFVLVKVVLGFLLYFLIFLAIVILLQTLNFSRHLEVKLKDSPTSWFVDVHFT